MNKNQQYKECLEIIANPKNASDVKESAKKTILEIIREEDNEIDMDQVKKDLANKMKGSEVLFIDGKEVTCNLEDLLEEALQYYASSKPYPELYILETDLETLYRDIYLS